MNSKRFEMRRDTIIVFKYCACQAIEIEKNRFSIGYVTGRRMLQQDLQIHTTYSTSANSVVPEQTHALVVAVKHAIIIDIV